MSHTGARGDRADDEREVGEGIEPGAGEGIEPDAEPVEGQVMPPDEPAEVVAAAILSKSFRGPVPSPEDLAEYERVLPGCADRLIALTENQASHRQEIERKLVGSDIKVRERGQIYGFLIAAAVIIGGIVLVAIGRAIEGFVALIGTVATLAGVFVYARVSEARNSAPQAEDDEQPSTELAERP